MHYNKKSQAAMEFLMTYGWALLVVLIAIAALAFFGLLNPSKFLPEKCEISPGVTCMDFNAQTDNDDESDGAEDYPDNITILLNNGMGQSMKLVGINVTDCVVNESGEATGYNYSIGTITEGQTKKVVVNCAGMPAESRFKSDVVLNYTTTIEGESLNHTKRGYLVVQTDYIG
ncbi:YpfN family protein [Candidatus Woesearchaeota archaeon]|nr:YpfN family protein [Candidatus Woesearchaeota archaeon]